LQAEAVMKVTSDAQHLANYLAQGLLPRVIVARSLRGQIPDSWTRLQKEYANGKGSWTRCLPIAKMLNLALQQCEP
jgi:hypothetical protein